MEAGSQIKPICSWLSWHSLHQSDPGWHGDLEGDIEITFSVLAGLVMTVVGDPTIRPEHPTRHQHKDAKTYARLPSELY
jgi:hypothetical protein